MSERSDKPDRIHAGIDFLKGLFGPSTEQAVYLCSLPNEKGSAEVGERSIADRDEGVLTTFANRWDQHGRGVFMCVGTVKAGSRRNRQNVVETPSLHSDVDFKSIRETPEKALEILTSGKLRLPPSKVVRSGNGYHAYWFFKEGLDTQAHIERIEAALRLLADMLAGDLQVAHVAALMRLPGSHNTKGGQWLDVEVIYDSGARYELDELEDWLTEQSPVLTRKERPIRPEQNPYLAIADQLGFKPPVDAEDRLAAMTYQGTGETSIHGTQLAVSAALLNRGEDLDAVVELLLKATRAAAGDYGNRWNWHREERNIRQMCATWLGKMGTSQSQTQRQVNSADVVHLDQARAQRATNTAQPAPTLIQAKRFILRDPTTMPKRKRLYGTHLFRKFTSATFGPTGSSKTNISIAEALAMASGRPLLGILPPARARVWLWNGEDPYDELERRFGAACLHYQLDREDLEGWLFVNSGRDADSPIKLASQTAKGIIVAVPTVDAIIETIRQNQIDVVLIDPFISTHNVMENDNVAIDAVAKTWGYIADVTDTAINLSHHTRKTGGAEVSVEDGRGAVALLNAVRPARVVNVMTEAEAQSAGIEDNRKRYFRISDGKNNLSLPLDRVDWFRSASVNLGNVDPSNPFDTEGDEVGVVTNWKWPDPMAGVTGADFERAATVIRGGQWRDNPQCKVDWVGVAVARALQLDLSDKADRAKVGGLIRVWLASGALVKVEGLDKFRKPKTYVEVAEQ